MVEKCLLSFVLGHLQSGWAIVSLPLGLYGGYRFAIFQDKRKEWNALIHDASKNLRKQIQSLDQGKFMGGPEIDALEVTEHLSKRRQRGFLATLKRYHEAHGDPGVYDPATGSMKGERRDIPTLLLAAKALHCYLKRR